MNPAAVNADLLILKLGGIRFATSLLVVLTASVLNRVLIVEYQTPAGLVAFIFAFQHLATPAGLIAGYFSDTLKPPRCRRVPFILGGMLLCLLVTPWFPFWASALASVPGHRGLLWLGTLLFFLFGIGTTVSATAVNALLVDSLPRQRRGAAMTLVWIMTLAGIIVGAAWFDALLAEGRLQRLPWIFGLFTATAAVITLLCLRRVEAPGSADRRPQAGGAGLALTLRGFAQSGQAWLFFSFLAVSVLFLAMQSFILTPFGGDVLQLPVGATTRFGQVTSYGTILGMGIAYWRLQRAAARSEVINLPLGLGLGAAAFGLLGVSAWQAQLLPALAGLWLLGLAKGMYNAGLSHLTMRLAHPLFGGVFMGLWNLISGLALALGEMAGGFFLDFGLTCCGTLQAAYAGVFFLEALGLLASLALLRLLRVDRYWAQLSWGLGIPAASKPPPVPAGGTGG